MYNLTEKQLKRLHIAMCDDNEHQCNRLNNYIHTDEYLTAEVVQVVREIVAEATKALQKQIERMKCCGNCKHMDFSEPNYCMKGVYRERQYVCDKWEAADDD